MAFAFYSQGKHTWNHLFLIGILQVEISGTNISENARKVLQHVIP